MAKSIRELQPISGTEAGKLLDEHLFETVTQETDLEGIFARKVRADEIEAYIDRAEGAVAASIDADVLVETERAEATEDVLGNEIGAEIERALRVEGQQEIFKANKMFIGTDKPLSLAQVGDATKTVHFPLGTVVQPSANSRIDLSDGSAFVVQNIPAFSFKYVPAAGPAVVIYSNDEWKIRVIDTGSGVTVSSTQNADGGVWDLSRYGCVMADMAQVVGNFGALPNQAASLVDAVIAEKSRAQTAEAAVLQAVSNETNDRITDVSAEAARATGVEGGLAADIAAEAARATGVEDGLAADIAAEATRAQTAEGDMEELTTTDKSSLVAAVNETGAAGIALADEISARIPADVPGSDGLYLLKVADGVLSWEEAQ
jgi:hypothetical protein